MKNPRPSRIYYKKSASSLAAQRRERGEKHPLTQPRQVYRLLVETALALLVTTNLEVLAALDGLHAHRLADVALQAENDLLGGLRLLVEDGLGLTAETTLLAVVTTLAYEMREGDGESVSRRSGGGMGERGERR